MFSQISAKLRLSSVPSGDSEFTKSKTLEASCNKALRTNMCGLLIELRNAFRHCVQCFSHASARSSAGHIVAIKRGRERNGCKKIFLELASELAQFIE